MAVLLAHVQRSGGQVRTARPARLELARRLDDAGNFLTDSVHLVERWTLIDRDTMHYEVRIEDPRVYTRPWTMSWAFVRQTEPGYELLEEACWEGERDLKNMLDVGYRQYYYGETWRGR